jgi:hypothetical protein
MGRRRRGPQGPPKQPLGYHEDGFIEFPSRQTGQYPSSDEEEGSGVGSDDGGSGDEGSDDGVGSDDGGSGDHGAMGRGPSRSKRKVGPPDSPCHAAAPGGYQNANLSGRYQASRQQRQHGHGATDASPAGAMDVDTHDAPVLSARLAEVRVALPQRAVRAHQSALVAALHAATAHGDRMRAGESIVIADGCAETGCRCAKNTAQKYLINAAHAQKGILRTELLLKS